MTLAVEDGSGKPDAESYAAVATFKTYCDGRGLAYGTAGDPAIEQALRRATDYLDGLYRRRWLGRATTTTQSLAWPRAGVWNGRTWLGSDTLPPCLVRACCEAALREVQAPGGLTPDIYPGERVVSEQVDVLSVEYADGGAPTDVLPVIVAVERLVAPLLRSASGALVMRA